MSAQTTSLPWGARAQLALDTVHHRATGGIPSWVLNIMDHAHLERLAGAEPGEYARSPEKVYLACQRAAGVCFIDQYIPRNPLTMGTAGYENAPQTATTGLRMVELDGVPIDSPDAVVRHLQEVVCPGLVARTTSFDAAAHVRSILDGERCAQAQFGDDLLKTGYGFVRFPHLRYVQYGYENYFMAYLMYPEVMEHVFSLEADLYTLENAAAARAYAEGVLPPYYRLDHDMADSNGTLVDIESLDRLWFPHFARCIEPLVAAGIRLLWHCDGNLMAMVPRLIDAGVKGFQGFQYEDGMDYAAICRMTARDGDTLSIIGGVSVTTTLPQGSPDDVRSQLRWLVDTGPRVGLFLGASSSIAPGVPWENLHALVEGLAHYRRYGRE
jgi:hypothetical protein